MFHGIASLSKFKFFCELVVSKVSVASGAEVGLKETEGELRFDPRA
jgi:hypothetical protein